MAIDYATSADLMRDPVFLGRCRIAVLHFAGYISGEDPTTPAHTSRLKWSQSAIINADAEVNQVMPILIMDPVIQGYGSSISDPDLQTAMETAVNKTI